MNTMSRNQWNHWREKVDSQKARLAKETAEFHENCASRYVIDGRSEGLDVYIDRMSIQFCEVALKAQMGINLMEDTLANAEIVDYDD